MPVSDEQRRIVSAVRAFVDKEVRPVASDLEHGDHYPHALVEQIIIGEGTNEIQRLVIARQLLRRYGVPGGGE